MVQEHLFLKHHAHNFVELAFLLQIGLKVDPFSFSAQTQPPAESHLGIHNNATYCLPFIAK